MASPEGSSQPAPSSLPLPPPLPLPLPPSALAPSSAASLPCGPHVLALPAELLLAILSALPVADLIQCRSVCRQWRAAVGTIAARDAVYAFRCHEHEHMCAQWAAVKAKGEAGDALERIASEDDYYARRRVADELDNGFLCSCGGDTKRDKSSQTYRTLYAARHASPHPPLRWEVAVAENALAAELAALAWPTLRFGNVLRVGDWYGVFDARPRPMVNGWLPAWRALTTVDTAALPATHKEMVIFATALVSQHFRHHTSSSKESALAEFADKDRAGQYYFSKRYGFHKEFVHDFDPEALQSLGVHACVAGLVLASGGAIATSYLSHAKDHVIDRAFDMLAKPDPTNPAALEMFADHFCDGDTALAAQWERIVREAAANGPAATAEDLFAISDADWKDTSAWMDVPLPTAFAFPGDDSSVPLETVFQALGHHVTACLPLYQLSRVKLMRLHGQCAWQLQQLRARQAAASWRICCGLGWTKWLRECEQRHPEIKFPAPSKNWVGVSDEAVQAFLDKQVVYADAVQEFLNAHLRMPIFAEVYEVSECEYCNYVYWLGGISPRGNLVGTLTPHQVCHSEYGQ